MKQSGQCPICKEQANIELFKVEGVEYIGICNDCGGLFGVVDISNGVSVDDLFKRANIVDEIEARRSGTPYARK